MKLLVFSLILASTNVFAMDCRDAVVAGYAAVNVSIDADEFSQLSFEELELTPALYNALPPAEQEEIYRQIKPLEVMVEETISMLNSRINRVVGSYYEFFMIDELEQWRSSRDELRACTY